MRSIQPNYSEFKDTTRNGETARSNDAAREIRRLLSAHQIADVALSDGIHFDSVKRGFHVVVPRDNDIEALARLRSALVAAGLEQRPDPQIDDLEIEVTGPAIPVLLQRLFPMATGICLEGALVRVTRSVAGKTIEEEWQFEAFGPYADEDKYSLTRVSRVEIP